VPTQGAVTRFSAQFYGKFLGGDKNFYKLVGEWSRYQRLDRWDIYAFRIKCGYARSTEEGDYIPSTDQFFLGGANTIRGYKENAVGPKAENGEPTGGKFYFINNHEIRRQIVGKFWGSVFIDIGQNWSSIEVAKLKDVLVSAGIGLQYVSPLGPIRLDYGRRISWKPVDSGGRFHITILYAF
jgi:outer membrane protein insertion porin family